MEWTVVPNRPEASLFIVHCDAHCTMQVEWTGAECRAKAAPSREFLYVTSACFPPVNEIEYWIRETWSGMWMSKAEVRGDEAFRGKGHHLLLSINMVGGVAPCDIGTKNLLDSNHNHNDVDSAPEKHLQVQSILQ